MEDYSKPRQQGSVRLGLLIFLVFTACLVAGVLGVASFFFLGADARALRNGFMASSEGRWHQRIAVNVGGMTTGLVRLGARFFKIPQEVQAGLESVRSAEVGVYKWSDSPATRVYGPALAAMDKKMLKRGWERVVGVFEGNDLVAVYVPSKGLSEERIRCCFLVSHDDELVVGSARCSLGPILRLPEVRKVLDQPWSQAMAEVR
jgi:hypothetical protein